ncbi:MAG: DUF5702 domain-containing protein [Lachnospiraceae bacterium]
MSKTHKLQGYVTIFTSLMLTIVLMFYFLIVDGIRRQTVKFESECIVDIGLHSTFGEYNKELLEQYDLFFIDTSYETNTPSIDILSDHIFYFTSVNANQTSYLTKIQLDNIKIEGISRASDKNGAILKEQILRYMEHKTGMNVIEEFVDLSSSIEKNTTEGLDVRNDSFDTEREINETINRQNEELDNEDKISINNPANDVNGTRGSGILSIALAENTYVSSNLINKQLYFSNQENPLVGNGYFGNRFESNNLLHKPLLSSYLFEKCSYYGEEKEKAELKYQMEYLLKGYEKDEDNLREVLEDILIIREGINFFYLMSDGEKMAELDAYATTITIVMPNLQPLVKMSLAFAWSYAESVKDIRILLDGGKVPIIKNDSNWNTPLAQLVNFKSHLGTYKKNEIGITYDEYIRGFLLLQNEEKTLRRFMDIIEMDIRRTPRNQYFRIDACIDSVMTTSYISSAYGYQYQLKRQYTYK